jgi:pyrroline-5-carboxylate reductase
MADSEVPRIGFLGAGRMATALAHGWLAAGLTTTGRLIASDPLPQARDDFHSTTGVRVVNDNRQVVATSDVLVVAVKPQILASVLHEIQPTLQEGQLVVSIAAGISLRQLADVLGPQQRLIRVMPNTPCLVGASASAYSPGEQATEDDCDLVERLMGAVGRAFRLPERLLDAVTGLSGSGPAFIYVMIEALADGGVRVGLPREVASVLAAQTVFGSAKMVLESGLHTGQLKDMVTSPGGTTIAGLHALERGGLRAALMDAVEAATKRSAELGKG